MFPPVDFVHDTCVDNPENSPGHFFKLEVLGKSVIDHIPELLHLDIGTLGAMDGHSLHKGWANVRLVKVRLISQMTRIQENRAS